MKKTLLKQMLSITLIVLMVCGLSACGGQQEESPETSSPPSSSSEAQTDSAAVQDETGSQADAATQSGTDKANILIAYFSLPINDGVDTVARASRKEWDDGTVGNVRFMAHVIQENTGGDLFSIETVQEYPMDSMDDLLEFAYEEKAENARPELSTHIENLDDYDVIFVGYPKMEQGYICV